MNKPSTELRQLWCLHGNLQTPAVWQPLKLHLQQYLPKLQVSTENLWQTLADNSWDWAAKFCQEVEAQPATRRFLLGYSLGGRLALHAVIHAPHLWAGAVIVGADPGIRPHQTDARAAQLARDRSWAHRFLSEPLSEVMKDWNQLPLFGGRPGPPCDISPYRQAIAAAFVCYSKGTQDDLRSHLQNLHHPPLLYITGSQDLKYTQIGQQLSQTCPNLQHAVISQARHRVPWDNPTEFRLRILTFLNKK